MEFVEDDAIGGRVGHGNLRNAAAPGVARGDVVKGERC
ncbi:hypothetical protein FRUB_08331 [Fimbriiglobus ruber]|uniref:Uncharacterized protein n=1 Tax=Fimbriiglobus ruber TaxID=1908690 RepID=A0A225DB53_9BACT|nr:hypothetical protein FRUB_08331 [Fimbriiglobus ruber]